MERAYRWFLRILGALTAAVAAVLAFVSLGFLKFSLQLCGKGGGCKMYSDPLSYLEAIALLLGFAGVVASIAIVAAWLSMRKKDRTGEDGRTERPLR